MRYSIFITLLLFSIHISAVTISETKIITISGTISGTCSLDVPSIVSLEDIPASLVAETPNNTSFPSTYNKEFKISSTCTSTGYNIYIVAPDSEYVSGCFDGGSSHKFLRFCLSRDADVNLPFTSYPDKIFYAGAEYDTYAKFSKVMTEADTIIKIAPGRGDDSAIRMGEYEVPLIILIEPI